MYLLHEFTASTKSEQKISKYVSVQNIQSVDVVYKIFQKILWSRAGSDSESNLGPVESGLATPALAEVALNIHDR